ncbi:MAG: tetratricopeptide repeat protein [Bacteroidia bacterium]|nr:tetratricopeptide repeat protein [Bacteroidia bacterium]
MTYGVYRGIFLCGVLLLWGQDPRVAVELFRMGRYEEAYPHFKRLFERTKDYLWGAYAVECLLQEHRISDYHKWLQAERSKGRQSIWGVAWELRRRSLEGDTTANRDWQALLSQKDLTLAGLEALAEVAQRVWGRLDWQREALLHARRQNPTPAAYAEALTASYERDGDLAAAWREWLLLWRAQKVSSDTLLGTLKRYLGEGLSPDSAEIALLELWQSLPHSVVAALLVKLYLLTENYAEALRYARAAFRMERDCRWLYEVGWNAYERGLFSIAAEAFQALLTVGESCPYYNIVVGKYAEAEALLRNPRQALATVDSLFRKAPEVAALRLEKARWHLRLGEADSVFRLMEGFEPSTTPALAQKYILLSEAALQKGDFARSRLYLLEAESRLAQSSWQSEVYFQLARLAYFQGEFELAKTRLRLLKNNTQDDLSNDAIQLFWHIEDNLKPDTLPQPLQLFAQAELLRLQGKYSAALTLLDSVEKTYRGHPLTDDIFWFRAQYYLAQRDTAQARFYLKLLADYPDSESLFRDDALYLLGEISRSPKEAAEYYERLLRELPGSLYARLAQEKLQKWAR